MATRRATSIVTATRRLRLREIGGLAMNWASQEHYSKKYLLLPRVRAAVTPLRRGVHHATLPGWRGPGALAVRGICDLMSVGLLAWTPGSDTVSL